MIHYRPKDYPEDHIPRQHAFLSEQWDRQHDIPAGASRQTYDSQRRVLMFTEGDEQKEIAVSVPPLWIGKDVGEWNG